jgi:Concanavalin A-like lectin/glucanases superfamily
MVRSREIPSSLLSGLRRCAQGIALTFAALTFLWSAGVAVAQTCVQAPSGVVAWWPFDETSGTAAQDVIGGNTGTYVGGPTPAAGRVGGALEFDGIDDHVVAPDSDLWAFGGDDFTVEFWVNFDTSGSGTDHHPGDVFVGTTDGPFIVNKWLFALGAGRLELIFSTLGAGEHFLFFDPFAPNPGQWYHISLRRQINLFTVFIDGEVAGSVFNSATIPNSDALLGIGRALEPFGGFFDGRLDEMTIYNRALSDLEIQGIFNAGSAGKCKELRIVPDHGGDTGTVTARIFGNGFQEGATVKLLRDGQPDIVGRSVRVDDSSTIVTTFDLVGVERGSWDVVVTNPDGVAFTVPGGFTVEAGLVPGLWVDVLGLNAIRRGRQQTFYIISGNNSNTDAYDNLLEIRIPSEIHYDMPISRFDFGIPELTAEPNFPFGTIINGEETIVIWMYSIPAQSNVVIPLTVTIPTSYSQPRVDISAHLLSDQRTRFARTGDFALVSDSAILKSVFSAVEDRYKATFGTTQATSLQANDQTGDPDFDQIYDDLVQDTKERAKDISSLGGESLKDKIRRVWWIFWNSITESKDEFSVFTAAADPQYAETFTLIMLRNKKLDYYYAILDGEISSEIGGSDDPNDKAGPQGRGSARYLGGLHRSGYLVKFENLDSASAAARDIVVSDDLDTENLNLSTFSLGPIAFGDRVASPPPGLTEFATEVDLRPENDLIVRIEAGLNQATGVVTWRLTSIDPATGQPPEDPLAGFLPPDVNPPEGEGSVLFTVQPKAGLATGTEIDNDATIVFDNNDPIQTPVWFNTIDNSNPTSAVQPLASVQQTVTFPVAWSGQDEGAGVRDFSVFVSEDSGPFQPWLVNTPDTSANFVGEDGKEYAFYSIARDLTGNVEDKAPATEAETLVQLTPADGDGDGVPDDQDACPDSIVTATVVIDQCDSGVPNTIIEDGCTISDRIAQWGADAKNHGQFVSQVSDLTSRLRNNGIITGKQKGAIQSCAAQANLP